MELVVTIILLALAGVCVGVLSGLLGIGGGIVMVPLLRLVIGLDAYMATATSLFAIIPTSLSGAVQHIRNATSVPKLGIVLGIGGAVTSSLGVYLASISPAWAIMLVTALVMVYSAYSMLRKALKTSTRNGDSSKSGAQQAAEASNSHSVQASACHAASPAEDDFNLARNTLLGGLGIGLLTGLFSGYVGLGGGFIMVPLMTAWLGVPMKKASGTSLIAIIILAIPGVIGQTILGHVDYYVGIALCAGAIPGAIIGARLVPHISERVLRLLFAVILAVVGVALIVNELAV